MCVYNASCHRPSTSKVVRPALLLMPTACKVSVPSMLNVAGRLRYAPVVGCASGMLTLMQNTAGRHQSQFKNTLKWAITVINQ